MWTIGNTLNATAGRPNEALSATTKGQDIITILDYL